MKVLLEDDAAAGEKPYAPPMARFQRLLRSYWFEAAALAVAAAGVLEVVFGQDGQNASDTNTWFAAPALACVVLPLLGRRRWPFAAPAAVWIVAGTVSFFDGRLVIESGSAFAAGMAAAFLLGNLHDPVRARFGLPLVLGGGATVVYNGPGGSVGDYLFVPVLFVILWIVGLAIQQRNVRLDAAELRAIRLAHEREESTRLAIADERARMARELHDVLGHSVSVMTIQAAAVRRLLKPEQARERDALLAVERTGREALIEMRRLVGILRLGDGEPDLEPQPGLDQLSKLVTETREAGLAVELLVEGEPVALPAGLDLTAYRLVQEGLTNARKHSQASRTEVRLRYASDGIEVEVCDNGKGTGTHEGGGLGLIGMRERVSIFGGELEAGPRGEGGYRLRARLPMRS